MATAVGPAVHMERQGLTIEVKIYYWLHLFLQYTERWAEKVFGIRRVAVDESWRKDWRNYTTTRDSDGYNAQEKTTVVLNTSAECQMNYY